MKKYLGVLTLVLSVCFTYCDKDDDQNGASSVPGCTDETAFNYDPNATEDDGSCIAVIKDVLMNQLIIMMLMQIRMMGVAIILQLLYWMVNGIFHF